MENKFECLNNLEKDSVLNDEQQNALKNLKEYVHKVNDNSTDEYVPEYCYLYGKIFNHGLVEDDAELIQNTFNLILYNEINESSVYDVYDNYPLIFTNFSDIIPDLDINILIELSEFCYYEIENFEMAFKCAKEGSKKYPHGLIGGMFLVNRLILMDACKVIMFKCLMYGKGVERDLPKAFSCFLSYQRDHLVQKYASKDIREKNLEELFSLLKSDSDNKKEYPGLYYSLAVMYREGIGTNVNYKKYLECVKKERTISKSNENSTYLSKLNQYVKENINADTKNQPYKNVKTFDDKTIKEGDLIALGKYDYRQIIWKVIKIENDQALLLATQCLESTYIPDGNISSKNNYCDSAIYYFVKGLTHHIFGDVLDEEDLNLESQLIPNENGDYIFLLSKDEVQNLINAEDIPCGARIQSQVNGYDDCGVFIDEFFNSACWWTSTNGDENDTLICVNPDGEFVSKYTCSQYIGIRPAIKIQLVK